MTARRGDVQLALGGTKQRTLLAVLALDPGRVVSTDRLVSALWDENPPASALNALQVYASTLRRALGDTDGSTVRWQRPGYLLDVQPEQVDAGRFRALVARAQESRRSGELTQASELYAQAMSLWRGEPLADVDDEPFAAGAVTWLSSERLTALEAQLEVDLARGRHTQLIGPLEQLVAEHPLRESLRGLLMLSLYRSGRQADALEVYRNARDELADQLGLDPGAELRALERAVLAQSPALDLVTTGPAAGRWDPTERVSPTTAQVRLAWLVGEDGERLPLDLPRTLVGRGDDCQVLVRDPRSSRRHAMIRLVDGAHEIIDLDSTNGTRVNALDLAPHQAQPLVPGDVVHIGQTALRYVRDEPAT